MSLFLSWLAIQVAGAMVFVILAKCFRVLVDDRPTALQDDEPPACGTLTMRIAAAYPTRS